jgi:cobalamin biosynthesis Mg chelatase CobN
MNILVADEAWLATALLHREHPDVDDFSLAEIRERSQEEFHDRRPGVWQHIMSHCVASNPPNPAQYRMLHSTGRGRRRLYRRGDPVHPERRGKIHPEKRDIPERYRPLVDWYVDEYDRNGRSTVGSSNPSILLGFVGLIPAYDLQKMSEAIASACERVDTNEW